MLKNCISLQGHTQGIGYNPPSPPPTNKTLKLTPRKPRLCRHDGTEVWEEVFDRNDVNKIFNSFLSIFLRIYYSSFPLTQVKSKMNQNSWIIPGIITSCKHKRELCKELQNNNNATLAFYYRDYSKILFTEILNAMNNKLL